MSPRCARTEGVAVVVIEHEMGIIERIMQRCVVPNYGRRIGGGAFAEIASRPGVQEAYLGWRRWAGSRRHHRLSCYSSAPVPR